MIQEDILPAGLGLHLAKPTLPMAFDPLGSSTTLPMAFDPLESYSTTLPKTLDSLESFTTSAALDPSTNSLMPAALDPSACMNISSIHLKEKLQKLSNLSAGFGLRSASWKSSIATLALFSSICSHGHGYSSSLHEKLTDMIHTAFSNAVNSYHRVNTLYDRTINCFSMIALSSVPSNETFTYKTAMKEKDYTNFICAMMHEVDDHEKRNHWTIMPRCNMPAGSKTIMSIWSFKQKRYPDGVLNKHKARLCAHGGQQTWGENYWETYAPVVNWASVCLILAIAKIHGLLSKSIDFVLAFPQADLETPV
jgi:hypothetical protein